MQHQPASTTSTFAARASPPARLRFWWRSRSQNRQDKMAAWAPLVAVLLFVAINLVVFWFLHTEELIRAQSTIQKDARATRTQLEQYLYQQQIALRQIAVKLIDEAADTPPNVLEGKVASLMLHTPALQQVQWMPQSAHANTQHSTKTSLASQTDAANAHFHLHEVEQDPSVTILQMDIPVPDAEHSVQAWLRTNWSLGTLLQSSLDESIRAQYAITWMDANQQRLAGVLLPAVETKHSLISDTPQRLSFSVALTLNGLENTQLLLQSRSPMHGFVGRSMFWLLGSLSLMTLWLLLSTWRHTRKSMQAQRALVSETNFRRAMENSMRTGMRALDMEGRITYVNAAFCSMTGWSEAELVGQMPPYSFWPEHEYPIMFEHLHKELRGQTSANGFQVHIRRKDNSRFDARMYLSPLVDSAGQQTGWMTAMTDITEPNRIREQLAASFQRFTIVLESLDAAVSVTPLGSGELLFANKLYQQWFGADDASGHLQLVEHAGSLTAAKNAETGASALPEKAGKSKGNVEIFVPALGKWLEVRSRYLNWADGRLAQMVIATDITLRHQAEDLAALQAERSERATRLITMGEMASSVAHELNQPLSAIANYCSGLISRLQNGTINEEMALHTLQKTNHQAQRAGQVIHRILSFVKKSRPNCIPSSVYHIVDEALELAEHEMRRRNVHLLHYVAARLLPLFVDPILIEQVLVNLMRNAAESIDRSHMPPQRRNVELRVTSQCENNRPGVLFSVSDSGMGLPPEVQGRLFEAFFSTKSDGMGIGLNLCRSIVESHQGRMNAQNLYNRGSVVGCCFSFWLPYVATPGTDDNTFSETAN